MIAVPAAMKGRQGALIVGGTALVVALLLLAGLVWWVLGGQSADTQEAVHQLALYKAEVGQRSELEAQLKTVRLRAAATPGLITDNNSAEAQAQLQDEVKAIVVANQGEVRTAQIVPASTVNGFQIIAIQYDLMVPMAKLRDLAYALETHTPYLFIDETDIVTQQDFQSGDPQNANPMIEVRWTIHGYRWGGAK